jgi:hypothetical protein
MLIYIYYFWLFVHPQVSYLKPLNGYDWGSVFWDLDKELSSRLNFSRSYFLSLASKYFAQYTFLKYSKLGSSQERDTKFRTYTKQQVNV